MAKKFELVQLEISSFVLTLDHDRQERLKGASVDPNITAPSRCGSGNEAGSTDTNS